MKSSREKMMGGFRLGWRIEKPTLSESKVGRSIQSPQHDEIFAGALGHDDKVTLMTSMVQMAQDFRLTQNMTEDEVLNKIIKEKLQNESIWGDHIGYEMCPFEQTDPSLLDEAFPKLLTSSNGDLLECATHEDMKTGLDIIHAIVYCPVMDIKLYNFVNQFLDESSRTIILSFVNYFQTNIKLETTMYNLLNSMLSSPQH